MSFAISVRREPSAWFCLISNNWPTRISQIKNSEAASRFMQQAHLGDKNGSRGLRALPPPSSDVPVTCGCGTTKESEELAEAGFVDIRRAEFGDASDPNFRDVEDEGRWVECLGVDCKAT